MILVERLILYVTAVGVGVFVYLTAKNIHQSVCSRTRSNHGGPTQTLAATRHQIPDR